ncbi:peptide synthetase [Sporolactobacillus inulinus CASD]|uniref:Peptide synthetase n=4 Tax=Sporolactobacillus inulinus TaxID=2078 RepID=A0A0U1QM83_9BACL|nr:peptide synthetase [Sporolactobacillus inulinus CASD]
MTTYLDTYNESRLILNNLHQSGIKTGDIVVLALEEHSDFIPLIWACVLGGIIPCPIIPRVADMEVWRGNLNHISKLLNNPTFIISSRNLKLFDVDNKILKVEDLHNPVSAPAKVDSDNVPDIAFLMLSSGSTGAPKAITLTHENILNSLEGKRLATGIEDTDITMNWIAFDHVAALTECHFLPLFTGSTQIQVPAVDIVSDPLFFLKIISKYRVSHTFTPNFLLGQITSLIDGTNGLPEKIQQMDFSCLKRIISGGEANVCETGDRFLNAFADLGMKRSVIWPAFGMTETCAGSIYSTNFENEIGKSEFATLGKPIPGLKIRILGENGEVMNPGQEGELQLHGAMIFNKYYSNEKATKEAFTEDGWFKTGDLGIIEPDSGSLRLVGRSKDSIIVNGNNYFLYELETVIGSLEGIAPSFIAAFSTRPVGSDTESLVVFYTPLSDYNTPQQLRNINIAIRNITILRWGFRPLLVLPVSKDILIKTSLGKIQRSKLRKKYESGEFDSLIADFASLEKEYTPPIVPAENGYEEKIINLFSKITGISTGEIGATSNFFSLGGTSLEILRLLTSLKGQFDTKRNFSLVDLLRDPTPRGIAHLASSKTANNKEYNPIVPLQKKGVGAPIFMIHPGVGEVLVFVNLANFFMDERPIYALRARGFNPNEKFFESFDELVSTYAAAIKQYQPHGPYYIAGYSYGGPVSLPVAQTLEAMGEKVHVLVIDAPPVIEHPRGKVDRVESALILSFFLGFIDKSQLDTLGNYLRESEDINPVDYLFSLAPTSRIRELGQDLTTFKHWNDLAYGLSQIGGSYKPKGSVNDITVFYAQPIWGSKADYFETMLKKWDKYSRSPVRYIEVPGEHHTILNPEFVDKFQEIFRSELSKMVSKQGAEK